MTNVTAPPTTELTITLDEALRLALAEAAQRRNWTVEQCARVILASHFLEDARPEPVRVIRPREATR